MLVAITAALLVAGPARAEPVPPPVVPAPPRSVDLRDFREVANPEAYTDTWRGGSQFVFMTPDGTIACSFLIMASCSGRIPAIGATVPGEGEGYGECPYVWNPGLTAAEGKPYVFTKTGGTCPPFESPVLPVGFKLSTEWATCAVGTDLVACIDERNHGFTLEPTGSHAF